MTGQVLGHSVWSVCTASRNILAPNYSIYGIWACIIQAGLQAKERYKLTLLNEICPSNGDPAGSQND